MMVIPMAVKIPREREKDVLETENQRLLTRKWKETGAGRRGMLRKKNKTSNTEMYVFSTIDCEESKRRRSSPEREAQSSHALLSLSLLRSSLRFCLYWYFLFLVSLLTGNEDEAVKEVKWKERERANIKEFQGERNEVKEEEGERSRTIGSAK